MQRYSGVIEFEDEGAREAFLKSGNFRYSFARDRFTTCEHGPQVSYTGLTKGDLRILRVVVEKARGAKITREWDEDDGC